MTDEAGSHDMRIGRRPGGGRFSGAVVAVAVAATGLVACGFPDRRDAADAIGDAVRRLPCVADERVRYDTSFDGGAHVGIEVAMCDGASSDQAATVGKTVVDGVREGGFERFDVTLDVTRERDAKENDRLTHSHAGFKFAARSADGPSASEVAGDLALWAQLVASPVLAAVQIQRPSFGGVDGRALGVVVRQDAADADLAALTAEHSELAAARWQVEYPAPDPVAAPRTFSRRGSGFPDTRLRAVWARIVEEVGQRGTATVDSVVPPAPGESPAAAELTIDIWDADGGQLPDVVKVERFGAATRSILQQFSMVEPGPVDVHLTADPNQDAHVIVGGCSKPTPDRAPTPLEVELRHTYERC